MPKFDETKIITPLHIEKARIGEMYFYSDSLLYLKDYVEHGRLVYTGKLCEIKPKMNFPFKFEKEMEHWSFLYPLDKELYCK